MKSYETVFIENWENNEWYKYDIAKNEEYVFKPKEKSLHSLIQDMNRDGYFLSAIERIGSVIGNRFYFTKEI